MPPKRVCAETSFRGRKDKTNPRLEAGVPAAVRDYLGAREGDVLVFELGNTFVAERAAVRGPYFVVTLRRENTTAAVAAPQSGEEEVIAVVVESLEETINRLRNERAR